MKFRHSKFYALFCSSLWPLPTHTHTHHLLHLIYIKIYFVLSLTFQTMPFACRRRRCSPVVCGLLLRHHEGEQKENGAKRVNRRKKNARKMSGAYLNGNFNLNHLSDGMEAKQIKKI